MHLLFASSWNWNFGHGSWDGTYGGFVALRKFGLDQEEFHTFYDFALVKNEDQPFRSICAKDSYDREVFVGDRAAVNETIANMVPLKFQFNITYRQ